MKKNNGGSAFPIKYNGEKRYNENVVYVEKGMSLRDYFAVHASDEDIRQLQSSKPEGYISTQCARYMHADFMIAEREK